MKISLIQTGGTIDKDYPKVQGGWAFEIGEPAVRRLLMRLNPVFEYEILSIFRKDSQEITTQDREELRQYCAQLANHRVVITHGTDTMIETGHSLLGIPQKIIVLTGAMRPEKFSDSDAPLNLGLALAAVQLLEAGVYIAMHGGIYPVQRVTRNVQTGQFILKK